MKKIILLLTILFLLPLTAQAYDESIRVKNPKTANAFLRWDLTSAEAERLSRYDLVILDMEQQVNHPELIKRMRQLNPKITILAYVSSQEIRNDTAIHPEITLRQEMFARLPESWYLRDGRGWKISFWPQTWMINLSNQAPLDKEERWNDYLPRFIDEKILASGLWDGIFYDNLWDSVNWLNGGQIDINNDGLVESASELNQAWQEGVLTILKKTRARVGYDYILMANSSSFSSYQPYLNGRMFEDWPSPYENDGTWEGNVSSYQAIKTLNVQPNVYIFNSTNTGVSNYPKMRYGLASALIFNDVYFAFDDSIYDHGQTWWYDEYDFSLGRPLTAAFNPSSDNNNAGLWQRNFVNGAVFLNNSALEQTFSIPAGYRKLYGAQDPVVNSAGAVDQITLGPKDGLILQKTLAEQKVYLKNYYHYQVYDVSGQQICNDYQWGSDAYPNGELVQPEKGGQASMVKERLVSAGGQKVKGSPKDTKALVRIYNAYNKLIGIFNAYPEDSKAGLKVAVGDVLGDKQPEIVVLPAYGAPQVKIFSFRGKLLANFWIGFPSDRYYYDLTLNDVNSDGLLEIMATKW